MKKSAFYKDLRRDLRNPAFLIRFASFYVHLRLTRYFTNQPFRAKLAVFFGNICWRAWDSPSHVMKLPGKVSHPLYNKLMVKLDPEYSRAVLVYLTKIRDYGEKRSFYEILEEELWPSGK